ncbi:hypothetical protein [Polyangium jinanense]|uniref:Uncharacterized protein n=1 Tax=Polyangium jinanense TaxID=2829994 RepID=A0A9X4AP21_9BACT|nr:hypothetical protein [Polyangium jinanense]MDC3953301.1 hypothetical protein [Polyangium jinanense]MDC3979579.1 hypothetical protein [Polyangium jinanense]
MAKKQVAVSLRKPPSPESIDAFVSGDEPPAVAAAPKRTRRASAKSEKVAETSPVPPSVTPVPESAVVAVEARAEAPAEPAAAPAEPVAEPAPAAAPAPLPEPTIVGGVPLRAVTVYLTPELAERLTVHCIQHDRDLSNVIGEALTNHLAPRLGAGPTEGAPAPGGASPPRPSPFWGNAPFPRVEWPPRRFDQIVEIGRILLDVVRRRGYAATA